MTLNTPRTQHPYHLYDAIHRQPELVRHMLADEADRVAEAARAAAKKKSLFIVGIGSSLYTAQIAEQFFLHLTAARALVRAEQSFEFVRYPRALGPDDAVILLSHTGGTTFSVEAFELARRSGALTIAISGENGGEVMRSADFLITAGEQEESFAYTKSVTATLARLALLAIDFAEERGERLSAARESLNRIPGLMNEALSLEPRMRDLAGKNAKRGRMILFGSGPNWPVAREIALKIKETSFEAAEGTETEQFLHGPFSEVDQRMTIVGLLAGNAADARARLILRAAGETGAYRIVFHVPSAAPDASADDWYAVPADGEWLSPFVFLPPLQLLTYYLALARGTNPDRGRQDQEPHQRARQHYKRY